MTTTCFKRFVVFSYENYYPCGGWHDMIGSYDTLDEALAVHNAPGIDRGAYGWSGHVIDLETGEEVA